MKETASQRKKDKVLRTSMYVAVLIGLAGFLIFSILAAITFGKCGSVTEGCIQRYRL